MLVCGNLMFFCGYINAFVMAVSVPLGMFVAFIFCHWVRSNCWRQYYQFCCFCVLSVWELSWTMLLLVIEIPPDICGCKGRIPSEQQQHEWRRAKCSCRYWPGCWLRCAPFLPLMLAGYFRQVHDTPALDADVFTLSGLIIGGISYRTPTCLQ